MSRTTESRADYRGLYYEWEHQQWSAGEIDLVEDHRQWHDTLSPELRRTFRWVLAPLHIARHQATETLVPFVDAAPTEEQQVILTTQLVDVARHLVFLDRFCSEVIGSDEPDMRAGVDAQITELNHASRTLLVDVLPDVSRRIRNDRDNLESLVEGIVTHHIVIEATLVSTGQRVLLDLLRDLGLLPGLREGLIAVARDGTRHVSFGVHFLQETVTSDERFAHVITKTIDDLTPVALAAIEPGEDTPYWDPLPYRAEDLTTLAREALAEHRRAIGVSA
ncbi:MAG TPA: ribonucleotide-diphosphate reductase subunit beta [Actinomycetota bacterium]|nr:ribonucleotide-diphosphate reductase subunit beta [Actinomycetota bacterium]